MLSKATDQRQNDMWCLYFVVSPFRVHQAPSRYESLCLSFCFAPLQTFEVEIKKYTGEAFKNFEFRKEKKKNKTLFSINCTVNKKRRNLKVNITKIISKRFQILFNFLIIIKTVFLRRFSGNFGEEFGSGNILSKCPER